VCGGTSTTAFRRPAYMRTMPISMITPREVAPIWEHRIPTTSTVRPLLPRLPSGHLWPRLEHFEPPECLRLLDITPAGGPILQPRPPQPLSPKARMALGLSFVPPLSRALEPIDYRHRELLSGFWPLPPELFPRVQWLDSGNSSRAGIESICHQLALDNSDNEEAPMHR